MSNILILEPLPLNAAWLTASDEAAAFPVASLLDPSPLVVWKTTGAGSFTLTIDLQADTELDTVYLGYTNASVSATWAIAGATAAQGPSYIGDPGAVIQGATPIRAAEAFAPYHAFWTGAPRTVRHLRLSVTQSGGAFAAGNLLIGKAWRPSWNYEWEAGRAVADASLKERLPDGSLVIEPRGISGAWTWTFGDLTDAETRQLWRIARTYGLSRPLLVVEDPDASAGLNERLHYGVFSEIQRYNREAPDKTRWEFTFEDWL